MARNLDGFCSGCGKPLTGSEIDGNYCSDCGEFDNSQEGGEIEAIVCTVCNDLPCVCPIDSEYQISTLILDFNGGTYTGVFGGVNYINAQSAKLDFKTDADSASPTYLSSLSIKPTMNGKIFEGWSNLQNGGVLDDDTNVLDYTKLYAVYKDYATIKYHYDGNIEVLDIDENILHNVSSGYFLHNASAGTRYTIPNIIICCDENYERNFLGWETDGSIYNVGDTLTNSIDRDYDLYASWGEEDSQSSNIFFKINNRQHVGISYVKVNGTYKKGIKNYVKVDGVWMTQ